MGELYLESAEAGPFDYHWPPKNGQPDVEQFYNPARYRLADDGVRSIQIAWTSEREAWGRKRERAIAFLDDGRGNRYPLIEFPETDDGTFAAIIPDPKKPRSVLTDLSALPDRFKEATVMRTDELFGAVRSGPSLRVVLSREDQMEMARHALWVGRQRGRI